jgi:hypothetical protein
MELTEALKAFSNLFGRSGVDIGQVEFKDDGETNDLDAFYGHLSFSNVLTVGGEMFINIPPYDKLSKSQEGWYLIRDKSGQVVNDDVHWNKDWIVFANRNDDAIYFNAIDKKIYGSVDKKRVYRLAGSMGDFFTILVECMKLEYEKYELDTRNEDEEVSELFLDDVYNVVIRLSGNETADDFMAFFFE